MGKTYLQGEILTALDLNNSLSELVNTTGYFIFTGSHEYSNTMVYNNNLVVNSVSSFTSNVTLGTNARLVSSNTISDRIGDVRITPIDLKATGGFTLVKADAGKVVTVQAGPVTVPANIFAPGESVTIWNRDTASITIAAGSGLTFITAGTGAVGNKGLGNRGLCTILFINATTAVITGSGVT